MFKYTPVQNLFVPKAGEEYRFIGVPASKHGNVSLLIGTRRWRGTNADKLRLSTNNVFKTFADANKVRTAIAAALKAGQTPPIPAFVYQNGVKYVKA